MDIRKSVGRAKDRNNTPSKAVINDPGAVIAHANTIVLHNHAAVRNLPSIAAYTFTGHEPRQNPDRSVRPLSFSEESDEDDSEDEEEKMDGLQKLARDQIRTAIFTSSRSSSLLIDHVVYDARLSRSPVLERFDRTRKR